MLCWLRGSTLFLSVLFYLGISVFPAWSLSLGTWNLEYFSVQGKHRYVPDDLQQVAKKIKDSGVQIIALQEIRGDEAMVYFVSKYLPGWHFAGNDTGRNQDLYFLWNSKKIKRISQVIPFCEDALFVHKNKEVTLFTRPPLGCVFKELSTGKTFTLMNLHLKSQSTRGKKDVAQAVEYNNAKRHTQMEHINVLAGILRRPLFLLGDFNVENPRPLGFPLISLPKGAYSYDNRNSNLDHIGVVGLSPKKSWRLIEVEGALPRRSTKKSEHPDHDMLVLTLELE